MENARLIKRVLTIIVFFTGFIYFLIQLLNIPTYQNNDINKLIDKVNSELNSREVNDYSLVSIEKGSFVCLFTKLSSGKMVPLIYNTTFFTNGFSEPADVYRTYKKAIRIYENSISGRKFVVWVNKFNVYYYIKYLIIPMCVIFLIYCVIMLLTTLLLGSGNSFSENNEDVKYNGHNKDDDSDTELYETLDMYNNDYNETTETEMSSEATSSDTIHPEDEYVNLWTRNFKISDQFKTNFPFTQLLRHLKFSYLPEEYIYKCIGTATEYFKWQNPEVYISQKDDFIECKNKGVLEKSEISVATDGLKKGDIFIPLYPYSKSRIFGYLRFTWNNDFPFFISDILYFLKFIFSQEARNIFANTKQNVLFKERIDKLIENNTDITVAVIEVDHKERYKFDLNQDEKNILNMKILDDITQELHSSTIFESFNFVYLSIKPSIQSEFTKELELFCSNKNRNYYISPARGNIAVTFSIGVSSLNGRTVNAATIISEAELLLDSAIESGGDQISSR